MRRVVVTGASGLLGSYVAAAFAGDCDVMGLDTRRPEAGHAYVEVSILDLDALARAFAGADCVAHIAAAPNIGAAPPQHIIELNTLGTWNVLEAALKAGVRRVLLCSTDSVMGNTVWDDFFWAPKTLPVPESHPLRPADPYGLSKLMAEEAGRAYARRGLEVLALRPVFILFPSMLGEVRARHANPKTYRGPAAGGHVAAGGGLCWHHVDPRDVATAFRLAATSRWEGYESFWLAAPSTLHPRPTLELIAERFGALPNDVSHAHYAANPFAPMFDTHSACSRLGWQAEHDHRQRVFEQGATK